MSVHISSSVWKSNFDTPLQKLILLAFADMANDEGYCWPSVRSIKERVGVADSTIRENVRLLEAAGWIKREVRVVDGKQTSNGYWVAKTPPSATALPSATAAAPLAPRQHPPSAQPSPVNHQRTASDESSYSGLDSDPIEFSPNEVAKLWNKECPSLPKVSAMTASRFKHAKARSDGDMAVLQAAFRRAEASDFIAGRRDGKKAWAHIDWLLKPDNWTKLHEGRYDNRPNQSQVVVDSVIPVSQNAF